MANLTLTIDDELLRRARLKALEQGVSVNGMIRDYLINYVGLKREYHQAAENILVLSKRYKSKSGKTRWSRDELHHRK